MLAFPKECISSLKRNSLCLIMILFKTAFSYNIMEISNIQIIIAKIKSVLKEIFNSLIEVL